jgi:hypothetical protein
VLAREQRSAPPEPGGDLVGDEQHVVFVADLSDAGQELRRVEVHPAGALHDRLEDDRRDLVRVGSQQGPQVVEVTVVEGGAEDRFGPGGEELRGQHVGELVVHAVHRVAHSHGGEGVAVVAAPHGQQAMALGPSPTQPVLDGHLDRHLDRHRPGVREEHAGQAIGGHGDQPAGQADRRRMGQPAEHDVRHLGDLVGDRLVERRVVVAVDRRPPRGHAVDQLAPVGQRQAHPVGPHDRQVGGASGARCVGMPHVGLVELDEIRIGRHAVILVLALRPAKLRRHIVMRAARRAP